MKASALSRAPVLLLENFAHIDSQEEVDELTEVIRNYYAQKLEDELERLWNDGTLNQQKLDELRGQHLRTPYNQ